ncbi:MAG: hydroxyisourate hydrolase [Duganella sp.]
MHPLRHFVIALALAASCALAAATPTTAAPNPLSVHVLDLQTGQPTAGIRVTLEQRSGDSWSPLGAGVTDAHGRIAALFPSDRHMAAGDYRIVFETGEHFKQQRQATFFPRIPVEFTADGKSPHYHIPLLLSPFGYSTYRGN